MDAAWWQVGNDRVALLRDGEEALAAMLSAIDGARATVELEMYWFGRDATGTEFRDALVAAARRGVTVRVLYDAIGSLGTPASFFDPLREAGGRAHEFAPLTPWRRRFRVDRVGFRDHRKILVVDGELAFTGGVNLADAWRPRARGGLGFRDDAVAVDGPAARELRALFFEVWRRYERGDVPPDAGRLGRKPTRPVWVLSTRLRHGRRRSLRRAYVRGLRGARVRVDIANAYFLPSPPVLDAMLAACGRGVAIRLLVPRESDVGIVRLATSAMLGSLLEAGVRVFEYDGAILHTKTAIFDDAWGTVGTYNLDMRSWRWNLECNLAVHDAAFAGALRASFERDLESATELTLTAWRKRPLGERVAGWAAHQLRHLL